MLKENLEKLCVREENRLQRNAVAWYGRRIYYNEQIRRQPCTTVSYSNEDAEDSMTAPIGRLASPNCTKFLRLLSSLSPFVIVI